MLGEDITAEGPKKFHIYCSVQFFPYSVMKM